MPELPVGKVSKKRPIKYGLMLAGILLSVFLTLRSGSTSAAPNSVIINELMYNPTGGDTHEFLELYNTTGSPIDMTNWAFTQGITHTFANGTIIPANGYLTMASNSAGYQSAYGGGSPDVQWTSGSLSNGGEALTLVDETAAVINSITYDDVAPWPTSPDGSGPSLELKQLNLDNADPTNWGASIGAPTPGVENSWVSVSLPVITSVSDPNNVTDADIVTITANVADADTVELTYKVNFDSDVVVPMLDDGLSGDGAASDGQYGADIPAQSAGQLVRFKISATNNDGTQTSPSIDDSMEFNGYVVDDPSVTSNAPIIQWFMDDADYDDMHTNHVDDNVYLPAVLHYDGKVYDNSQVRIKGEFSRTWTKKSYKFKLPSGSTIDLAGGSNRQIKEFHMNSNFKSEAMGTIPAAWWLIEESGMPATDILPTRLQRNGEFEGLYVFGDKYENEWRQENGFDDGVMYEDYYEPIDTPDISIIADWNSNMITPNPDPAKLDYILDNSDLPNTFNFMAIQGLLQSWDHYISTNTMSYKSNATGRWSMLYWDMDSSFNTSNGLTYVSPYDFFDAGGQMNEFRFATANVYYDPLLRELYYRRLQTLVDKFYSNDQLLAKFREYADFYDADSALDIAKWPSDGSMFRERRWVEEYNIEYILKQNLTAYFRQSWLLPASQTDAERQQVFIEEANYDADSANEYIKISNNSSAHVDISDWEVEGINYIIPSGSVVPAGGSIYLLKDDIGYKASHNSVLVAGQYPSGLSNSGGQLVLNTDTGMEIDSYDY